MTTKEGKGGQETAQNKFLLMALATTTRVVSPEIYSNLSRKFVKIFFSTL